MIAAQLKGKALVFGIGLAIVAVMIGLLLWTTRGSHIRLEGKIQKVRLLATDEKSAVVVVDFRFVNPADYPFVVRTVQVFAEMPNGERIEGMSVSDVDAKRMFDYYAELGPKYNESLMVRDKVAPGASLDRMVASRFEIPQPRIEQRRRIVVRVEDVDGAFSELIEEGR
jgi:hypothetical protein